MSYKCALIAILMVSSAVAQNMTMGIGFPEEEQNDNLRNKDNRKPLYLPSMCSENELYYPGDQQSDWICDCRPSFLYHPPTDMCWPAYQKGPCPDKQYLVLSESSVVPVCQRNPCESDGYVLWNGKCERLGTTAPCKTTTSDPAELGVNATTTVVSCVKLRFSSRLGEDESETIPQIQCPAGCKRSISGKCVPNT